jgi:hypothetical protein
MPVGLVQIIQGRGLGRYNVVFFCVEVGEISQEISGEETDPVENNPDPFCIRPPGV